MSNLKTSCTLLYILSLLLAVGCTGQQKKTMDNTNKNSLLCDPKTGVCEVPITQTNIDDQVVTATKKPVKVIVFTDPICSSCWGIEPQLRKLKLEYGAAIEFEYRMGGLLPDWSYNSGGISKPADVAHHWDEVSQYYDMPIDGDVWLEDQLDSSYPPSIAFKAAQMQDKTKADRFMRRIREMVFLEKKNITKWAHLSAAASQTGLDPVKLKADYESTAKVLFEADLALAKQMGVRGFPTLFFVDATNTMQKVYGFKPYAEFEAAVLKTFPKATKANYDHSWSGLFGMYPTLTTREFSELSGIGKSESHRILEGLLSDGSLGQIECKNGVVWYGKQ